MALTKEVKIGLLALISLVIFFVGFYFLKGSDIFSTDQEYYCYYNNVEGLQNSAYVQVKGLNIGHVSGMSLITGKGVRVAISIRKGVELPEGTQASLESYDLLGTKMIVLLPGPGPGILKPGADLAATREGGVVDNVSAELTPRLKELKTTISGFDTTIASVNALVNEQNQREISSILHSVNLTAQNLAEITDALKKEVGDINKIVGNTVSISANLARNNDTIDHILTNLSGLTRQLNSAPIVKTVDELKATITEFKAIAEKINDNKGSAGMLINNKDLYINLNNTLRSLDSLETDLKAHPKRYINVSVFGGGRKE